MFMFMAIRLLFSARAAPFTLAWFFRQEIPPVQLCSHERRIELCFLAPFGTKVFLWFLFMDGLSFRPDPPFPEGLLVVASDSLRVM